jgi:hypothetical protein
MIEVRWRTVYSYGAGLLSLVHMCELVPEAYERHWIWASIHLFYGVFCFKVAHEYSKSKEKAWF